MPQNIPKKVSKFVVEEIIWGFFTLKSEMKLFEATINGQQRGDLLQKLFVILKNIAPTSIASEQSFSIAANFVAKIRSKLSDQAIDDLCF